VRRKSESVRGARFDLVLPQPEVVGEVDEGGDGRAGGDEHDLERALLGERQAAVLDTVCTLVFCSVLVGCCLVRCHVAYHSRARKAAVCTCQR